MTARLGSAAGFVAAFARFGGRHVAGAVALVAAGSAVEGLGLGLLLPMLEFATPGAAGSRPHRAATFLSGMGVDRPDAQLAALLAGFALLIALRAVILLRRDAALARLTLGFADAERAVLVGALASARWSDLARLRHSRIGHVLSREIASVAQLSQMLPQIVVAAILLVVQVGVMILISPRLALLALGLVAAGLVAMVPIARRASRVGAVTSRAGFWMADDMAGLLGGLKLAIAHDLAPDFAERSTIQSRALSTEIARHRRYQSRIAVVSSSLAAMVGAGMIFGAGALGVRTVVLLASLAVLTRMSGPLRTLQLSVEQFFLLAPAYDAIVAVRQSLAPSVSAAPPAGRPLGATGLITCAGVGFRYPDEPHATLTGVDLTIAAGETVGLAGESGAGKTTLLDLLAGLHVASAGVIAMDGQTLDDTTLAGWRARLAYVAQDPYLLDDTIRRNLQWGSPAVPNQVLWDVLAKLGMADFVGAMAEGLDTRVGERGLRLSGGQRQRLGLARAILRRPGLVMLDEATNALDLAAERAVLGALCASLPNAAILIVAHRAETLRACDRVVELVDGRTTATAPRRLAS